MRWRLRTRTGPGYVLHAVDTDLQDEAIRKRLRPLLQTSDVQDEDLIQLMNEIVLEERKRKSKLGSSTRQKNPNVNEVDGSAQQEITDKKMESPETEISKGYKVMAALKAVRSELATFKESVEKNQANEERLTGSPLESQNQQWHRRPIGCSS